MNNSIASNNYIYNQNRAIVISESHYNKIYGNYINNVDRAVNLIDNSSANQINKNTVINSKSALSIRTGAHDNAFYSNHVVNTTTGNTKLTPILIDNKTADPKANKIYNNTIVS